MCPRALEVVWRAPSGYQPLVRLLAGARLAFVDILAANGETGWLMHFDGVHANDLGHRIIANEVFKVLAQNCSGLAVHTKVLERVSPRWRDESVLKANYGY